MNLSPKEKIIYFSKKDNFITFQWIRLFSMDHIPIIGVKVFTGLICLNTLYGHAFHMSIYVLIKDEIGCL